MGAPPEIEGEVEGEVDVAVTGRYGRDVDIVWPRIELRRPGGTVRQLPNPGKMDRTHTYHQMLD